MGIIKRLYLEDGECGESTRVECTKGVEAEG